MFNAVPVPISHLISVAEPLATAILLGIFGVLTAVCVLASRTVDRLGIPVVLLFLVLGMLGGSQGFGGVEFSDYEFAARLGTMALILILFDGGLNTSVSSVRQVLWPSSSLATVGVAATAGILALFARLFGLSWSEALLLGAVVSSTDAAAVFAVLRGGKLHLEPRVGRTLEVESCINDPMAVILTTAMIEALTSEQTAVGVLLLSVPLQLIIGALIGVAVGFVARILLRRVRLTTPGLYPALSCSLAFVSFGLATVAWGSGFLAVYATALVIGNSAMPYRSGLTRVHDALAWLSQIAMFLMLGLLVFPSRLLEVAGVGLALSLLLAAVARPLSVLLSLLPFAYPMREKLYIGWIGLRGAVPIILATFPVLAQVEGAERVFDIVFFIVVVSSLVPGATIRPITRRMGLILPERPAPEAVLEINSTELLDGELVSFHIAPSLAVCGAKLSEIEFPAEASVVLIVRKGQLVPARGDSILHEGDHAYLFFRGEDRPLIELLFGSPEGT